MVKVKVDPNVHANAFDGGMDGALAVDFRTVAHKRGPIRGEGPDRVKVGPCGTRDQVTSFKAASNGPRSGRAAYRSSSDTNFSLSQPSDNSTCVHARQAHRVNTQ